MTKPDFVYVTYIATTPEKVWQALVDTNLMSQYWVGSDCARVNVSDWKPVLAGSTSAWTVRARSTSSAR